MKSTEMIYIPKHFKLHEFECPCCLENKIETELVMRLDQARKLAGVPFRVNSGYRCEKHNAEVGGKPDSAHVFGTAADIACDNSRNRMLMLDAFTKVGFNRVGIAKTFIHVDIDLQKDEDVCWLYS